MAVVFVCQHLFEEWCSFQHVVKSGYTPLLHVLLNVPSFRLGAAVGKVYLLLNSKSCDFILLTLLHESKVINQV